ncbi:MAG: GDP-L-fucose synthase [Methanocella sp.]
MSFWDGKNVLVTGGAGFLGSFVVDKLISERGVPKENIRVPRSHQVDLRKMDDCIAAVKDIDIVVHAAGRVGGIEFNRKYPGTVYYDNIMMNTSILEASRAGNVEKFVGIGSVCAYPKFASVPFNEDEIWEGYPEETNAPYGLSKKMMLVQSQAYRQQYNFNAIHLLLVNLYGPGDNFDPGNSHVIAALIKKFADAKKEGQKEIVAWGTGKATREFLYVEDAAEGILLAAEKYNKGEPVNLGSGHDISIKDLVDHIAKITAFDGRVVWDTSKPDGQPKRCLNVTRAEKEFGFKAKTSFETGLRKTIEWYANNIK